MSQFGQWVAGLFGRRASASEQAVGATSGAISGATSGGATLGATAPSVPPRRAEASPPATAAMAAPSSGPSPHAGPQGAPAAASPTSAPSGTPALATEPSAGAPVTGQSVTGQSPTGEPTAVATAVPTSAATPSENAATQRTEGRSKFLPVVVALGAIALSLWMLNQYRDFVGPIFFSLNMMITAYPLYRVLRRFKAPTLVAVLVTGLAVIAFLALFLFGMYWAVAAMVQKMPEYNEQFTTMYSDIITFLADLGLSEEMLRDQIMSIDPSQIASFATGVLASAGNIGTRLVVLITALMFMLMDTPQMQERLDLARTEHGGFIDSLGNFAQGIRRYWIVTTVFGLIVAILDLAILVGLGVPLALVWAIFSFLTNYIPNIGFVIGLVPPALLALVDSGPRTAIAVVVAYSVLNFVVQSIIQPKFAGNAVGLTPTVSFLSLLLWTAVLGPLGALLALPMSLLVKALLIDPDSKSRWINALISSRPQDAAAPEPALSPNYPRADD